LGTFQIHTLQSAPAESLPALRALEQGLGFVPNLAATMAESPVLITGFVELRKTLAESELTGVERETVALAVSLENQQDPSRFRLRRTRMGGCVSVTGARVGGGSTAMARSGCLVTRRTTTSRNERPGRRSV
jgi:hypothetical protein